MYISAGDTPKAEGEFHIREWKLRVGPDETGMGTYWLVWVFVESNTNTHTYVVSPAHYIEHIRIHGMSLILKPKKSNQPAAVPYMNVQVPICTPHPEPLTHVGPALLNASTPVGLAPNSTCTDRYLQPRLLSRQPETDKTYNRHTGDIIFIQSCQFHSGACARFEPLFELISKSLDAGMCE